MGRQILYKMDALEENGCPGGARRGMCLKLSLLQTLSTQLSVAGKGSAEPETVFWAHTWLEKGNS